MHGLAHPSNLTADTPVAHLKGTWGLANATGSQQHTPRLRWLVRAGLDEDTPSASLSSFQAGRRPHDTLFQAQRRHLGALALGAALVIGIVHRPSTAAGLEATIATAVFSNASVPTFTIQGRLTENDQLVNTTIDLVTVALTDTTTGGLINGVAVDDIVVTDGLFTVEVPLPDTEDLLAAGPVTAQINSRTLGDIGGPITVGYTPRAWTAFRAASAQHADTAATAISADSALVADGIADSEKVSLTPDAPFSGFITASRIGDLVYLNCTLSLNVQSSITTEIVAVLPEEFRPSIPYTFIGTPTASFGTSALSTTFSVAPDGNVLVSYFTSAGSGSASLGLHGVFHLTP